MEIKKIYDVETIIKKCDSIEDKNKFINFVSETLQEKQKEFLYQIYAILKRDFILKTLEKTLKIMNEGGIEKKDNNKKEEEEKEEKISNKNIRSIGGTFIHLVKTSDLISKDIIKKIFWRNTKKKAMKKKLYKSLNNLNININDNNNKKEKEQKNNKNKNK